MTFTRFNELGESHGSMVTTNTPCLVLITFLDEDEVKNIISITSR